jgi:hypothetical protein
MTDVDEHLLTAAKLAEAIDGDLDSPAQATPLSALADDHRGAISFLEDTGTLRGDLQTLFAQGVHNRAARDGLDGRPELLSHLVGITEQDLEADEFSYTLELIERVRNNDAPLFLTGFGLPNTGKTGHILHDWHRAWKTVYPDGVSISNAEVRTFDHIITSLDELVTFCLNNPDVQKFVFVDEGSTHFDARTNSHEVASQFSPFSKRFAKLSVDFATIGHTVKDVHPEVKRQTTTFFYKQSKKQVQFFDDYRDDDLLGTVFPDPVDGLEKPPGGLYDPDDWSPLSWDLDPDRLVSPEE